MTFTYDPTTDIGRVRRRVPDKVSATALFTDEEIQSILNDEGSNWKRAAAQCLETIASQQAYIQKVIRLLNLSTDGAKLAAEFRAQAKDLRQQAEDEENTSADIFDWAEQVFDVSTADERLVKEILRG